MMWVGMVGSDVIDCLAVFCAENWPGGLICSYCIDVFVSIEKDRITSTCSDGM